MKKDGRLCVLEELSRKYPGALTTVSHLVKPITDDLELDIFRDLGACLPREFKKGIYSALAWYRTWPVYLTSIISERGKCNLKGEVVVQISVKEKFEAARLLAERGLLTKRIKTLLKARTGRIETTYG